MNLRHVLVVCSLAGFTASVLAQFKIVAPDGTVTYSDRPPTTGDGGRVTSLGRRSAAAPAAAEDLAGLPYDLRQLTARYPVTLYTAARCSACDAGRSHLQQRGIPYAEKTIATEQDITALERNTGSRTIPSLTIGQQGVRGFNPAEWNSYLDAAGYPRESLLPKGWKPPAASPLTAPAASAPVASAPAAAAAPLPAPTPPAAAAEPAPPAASGIRF